MNTKKIGDKAEDFATKILENKGFEILERNYRFKRAEIDIIALYEDTLVFVEVKALYSFHHGFPEDRVNEAKIKKLMEAAEEYIYAINWTKDIRFDVISVDLSKENQYHYIYDAFN